MQAETTPPTPTQPSVGSNGLAVAALVLGVLSFPVLAFLFAALAFVAGIVPLAGWFAAPLALAAIVFGVLGISQANRTDAGGKGMAVTGLVLGALYLAWTLAGVLLLAAAR